MAGRALVIGGSGMLSGCVTTLVNDGWRVVVPSRRHAPIPDQGTGGHARVVWVAIDWLEPGDCVRRCRKALSGPADLLVAWVHASYRHDVFRAVPELLRPGAPVVEVFQNTGADPRIRLGEPSLPDHPTQLVVLGYVEANGYARNLSSAEISRGVAEAVQRAVTGRQPMLHQIGEPHPWALQP